MFYRFFKDFKFFGFYVLRSEVTSENILHKFKYCILYQTEDNSSKRRIVTNCSANLSNNFIKLRFNKLQKNCSKPLNTYNWTFEVFQTSVIDADVNTQ